MLMGVAEEETRMIKGPVSERGMAVERNGLLVQPGHTLQPPS